MPLHSVGKLGPYEIIEAIGAGGMGEVYRAIDTRLGRTVAIKILPPHLADEPDARQRFEREARAISRLNHPHICALFDVGQQDGVVFLVMEYLDGETLAARLGKGPVDLPDLLRIGAQIAGALHAAHDQGIVHRDLKPGNIMLTRSGAKLLDFGLAKTTAALIYAQDVNATATASGSLTADGSIVGTIQYMAPEQLQGLESDARTDIFALGLVLYEMATGRRAFHGQTHADLIASIIKEEPRPVTESVPMTPKTFDSIVLTCLAKDPDARWQSARDVEIQLGWLESHVREVAAAAHSISTRRLTEYLSWGAVVLLLVVVILLTLERVREPVALEQVLRSSLTPPPGRSFVPDNFAISPDGARLAFAAVNAEGKNSLWVRTLSSGGVQEVNESEGAALPFWAPDSSRVGFFAGGKLKVADLIRGSLTEICDATLARGGTWNREDIIVFSPSIAGPLFRVSASGGAPAPVTRVAGPRGSGAHRWPHFLPDGKHFLYFVDWSAQGDSVGDGIYIGSLESTDSKQVFSDVTGNVEWAEGQLLYVQDRRLMAQPFDSTRLETTGPAVPISDQELEKDLAFYRAGFSVSANGMLIFQSAADGPSTLVWYDSNGEELNRIPAERLRDPRISPDGYSLAVSSDDLGNGKRFIHVYDLIRGVNSRLTSVGDEEMPVWSRDGNQITFVSTTTNDFALTSITSDGSGEPTTLLKGSRMIPNDLAPDGSLVFMDFTKGPSHLSVYSPEKGEVTTIGLGAEAQFSPDGKWISYVGGRQSVNEIFVQPYPGLDRRVQISNGGGSQARWRRDGRNIFYVSPDRKMMSVSFDPQKGSAGTPRVLFQTRILGPTFVLFQYDVTPDGRFLINSFSSDHSSPLTLVTHWPQLLKR